MATELNTQENNEVAVAMETAMVETMQKTGLTGGQKALIAGGVTLLTAGITVLAIQLKRKWKQRKAAQEATDINLEDQDYTIDDLDE